MPTNSENNKRIAKNTLALYFRQMVVMGVSLFTSRIVLQTLGVTDYGINNVVGGVVALSGIFSAGLMQTTQRFITVEMGRGNKEALQKIFSTNMMLNIVVGVIVLVLAETIGLWFLENKLVIPDERMAAARWVYQFAVFGFLLSLFSAPFAALIISHEDMHVYGYMGIFDVVMRMVTVYLLVIVNADKLVFLAIFGFAVSCIVTLIYVGYCRKKYQEARFSFVYDTSLLKELSGFGGYMTVGAAFHIISIQGVNMILNLFFGPVVNAARGIAITVNTALTSFGNNFKQALVPQLTKSYAAGDYSKTWSLNERGTRMTYFLYFIFAAPILLETEFILKLWLGNVPEYSAIFTRLVIIHSVMMGVFAGMLYTINAASGNVRAYHTFGYVGYAAIIALSYYVCKIGYAPQYVFVVPLIIFPPCYIISVLIVKKQTGFPVRFFIKNAVVPILWVTAVSFIPFYFIKKIFGGTFSLLPIVIIITSMLWTGGAIMLIGLRGNERTKIIATVKRRVGMSG